MRHSTITARDLECLEHMRNVGQLVSELMVQDCTSCVVTRLSSCSSPP